MSDGALFEGNGLLGGKLPFEDAENPDKTEHERWVQYYNGLQKKSAGTPPSQISDRQIRIEKKLKAISTLVKRVEDRGGNWCQRDLNNLEQDINEALVRNVELTGIEVT